MELKVDTSVLYFNAMNDKNLIPGEVYSTGHLTEIKDKEYEGTVNYLQNK